MRKTAIKVAESLSLALNPFLLIPVVFLVALFVTPFPSPVSQIRWLGVVLLCNFIVPFWWVYFLDQKGIILDDTLAHKKLHRKRLMALWPVIVIIGAEVITMTFAGTHQPLYAVLISGLAVTIVGGIISYYWKISAHMAGFSTALTQIALLTGPWVLWGVIAIPFLVWARLVLHRHTPTQLFIGVVVPPLIIISIFRFFKLI